MLRIVFSVFRPVNERGLVGSADLGGGFHGCNAAVRFASEVAKA